MRLGTRIRKSSFKMVLIDAIAGGSCDTFSVRPRFNGREIGGAAVHTDETNGIDEGRQEQKRTNSYHPKEVPVSFLDDLHPHLEWRWDDLSIFLNHKCSNIGCSHLYRKFAGVHSIIFTKDKKN